MSSHALVTEQRAMWIPQLHQAAWWRRGIRTVLLLSIVLLVVAGLDRPALSWLFLLPVLIWAGRAIGRRPLRLDTATGTLTVPHWWAGWRRVPLAGGVALLDDGRQCLVLQIGDDTRARVPILRLTGPVRRTQRPELLRALADQLDRHAPAAGPVTDRLRAQAAYLAGGGRPLDSPLAGSIRYSNRWTGVGSGLNDLLDTLLPCR